MDRAAPIQQQREQFEENGWTLLKRVLPLEVADATLYAIQKDLGGDWESYRGDYIKTFLTDKKAYECYSFDYTPMATLQWGLTPYVSAVAGKDLLPSHGYFRVYRKGDVCHVHSDAKNCEYSLSMALGYSNDYLWDLNISAKAYDAEDMRPVDVAQMEEQLTFHSVTMGIGDGVLYNGISRLHGRIRPNPNKWTAQIFMHWVDRAGKYAQHAFDGRAAEIVRRAEFVFPEDDAPEKINPGRADMVKERGR